MLSDWLLRLRSLFRHRTVEQELDEELRFHLDQQVASLMRQGLSREEAVRRARVAFGGLDQIKEEHREARGIRLFDDLSRDVRHAARQLWRSPGFALLAVLCLGLGIGVNTAIFSVLNAVLVRPLPVAEPDALVVLSRGQTATFSYPAYRHFQAHSRTLSGLTVSWPMESDIDIDGDSAFVTAEVVSANYGDVLGITPVVGRWFEDDREPAAVISHAIWQRQFDLSPDVLGRQIRSESQSYTIVGVAPREFGGVFAPLRTDLWVPVRTRPHLASALDEGGGRRLFMLFGRLHADATAAQAAADLNALDAQVAREPDGPSETLSPITAESVRGIPKPPNRRRAGTLATLLAAIVGLVLVIACVNVGHLVLARGAARQRELAVRRALGASRGRLFRQLLTECLLLALGGALCGLVLALWTTTLLELSLPSDGTFAVRLDLSIDWRTLLFAAFVSLAAMLLCGLLPAWRASQTGGLLGFKGEIGGGRPHVRPFGLVAQVVMSLALLFLAGSVVQGLLRVQSADPGFEVDGRLYAYALLPSPPFTPERGRELYAQAIEQLQGLPGVPRAAITSSLPLMPSGSDCASHPAGVQIPIATAAVDTGYFETMGIRLVAGRTFLDTDVSSEPSPVVVNDTLARRLWPDGPRIGERVTIGCQEDVEPAIVIGVVRDAVVHALGEPRQPHLYRPFARAYAGGVTAVLVDTSTDPVAMAQPVRRTLLGLDPDLRVYAVEPLGTHVDRSYAHMRWLAAVVTAFGLLALLLAATGLYGVMAYRVTLRTREIGLRMALGATRRELFRAVVGHGLAIVLVGVALGQLLAVALTRVMSSLHESLRSADLTTHIAVGLIWIAVAVVACYLPAARAARVDPLVALRQE